MKTDVVVIGSGISGLTTAAILAKKGKKVTIIERNTKAGGALRRFVRKGVHFDIGFHYTAGLGPKEILRVLWEYLGICSRLTIRQFPGEGNDTLRIKNSDRQVRCYFSYQRLEDELHTVFPKERQGISEYLSVIREVGESIPFYTLDQELTPFLRDFFPPMNTRLTDILSHLIQDPDLHAVLSSPAFLHGVPPRKTSIATHALVAHGFYSGAYTVEGGGQAIADAYISALQEFDVNIMTGQEAQSIIIKNSTVGGVITEQGEIAARDVIFTGHPTRLLDLVPEDTYRPAFANRLRGLANTSSMFVVFGKMNKPQLNDGLRWTNFYDIPSGFDILDVNIDNPEDSALMLTAPGMRDARNETSRASEGAILMRPAHWDETLQFSRNGSRKRNSEYTLWKQQATEKLLAKGRSSWGNFCDITPLASGSPLTFRDELGAPEGAVYGVQHNMDQIITGARTRTQGLWLSGQSTLMNGIMGSSLAGMVSAGEICGLESLWNEVKACR
ncbi:phytoene desaturase family protein [Thermodesulfobacteriota bacterium]